MVFHARFVVFPEYTFRELECVKRGLMAFYVLMCRDHTFCRMWNFEPIREICLFLLNFLNVLPHWVYISVMKAVFMQ